jgi:NADH-quinone oxidoreductase subunit I
MGLYKFIVDETKCMNCGACMDLCPSTCIDFTRPTDMTFYGAVTGGVSPREWMMEKPYLIDQERCTGCGVCVRECPTDAIELVLDGTKPISARPKPVIIRRERLVDDGFWHPLSEYTTEYLKRPVTSLWTGVGDWKPMIQARGTAQVWRKMKKPVEGERKARVVVAPEEAQKARE